MTAPGAKEVQIARMFRAGLSLDLISEVGLLCGWTRLEARSVLEANCWELNWDGKIITVAEPDDTSDWATVEKMLEIGLDHEVPAVKLKARRALAAIDGLRKALIDQEEADYRESLKRKRSKSLGVQAKPIRHGTLDGYLAHRAGDVPLCGLCAAAGEAQNDWPRDYTGDSLPGAPGPLQRAGRAS